MEGERTQDENLSWEEDPLCGIIPRAMAQLFTSLETNPVSSKIWFVMAHLHCRRQTRIRTLIRIPNLVATLYCAEHVHIVQTQTRIPTPYFCMRQESEFKSITKSVSSNVNEP